MKMPPHHHHTNRIASERSWYLQTPTEEGYSWDGSRGRKETTGSQNFLLWPNKCPDVVG